MDSKVYTHEPITDCAQDPRFNTFAKRLIFFQGQDETDAEFAKRLGMALSTLRRWKRSDTPPNFRWGRGETVAEALDVGYHWLFYGWNHKVTFAVNGLRLTVFRRYKSRHLWGEFPDRQPEAVPNSAFLE